LLALPSCLQVVERDMTVGGAIGLHLIALLLPGDGDIAGIPTGIDDGAEVTCRGVVEVASPPLVRLDRIDEFTMFLLDVICIFYLVLSRNSIPIVTSTSSSSGSRR
jgi:hypothetical protein